MNLIEKVESSNLIKYGDKIVIGVSGGPDSICLFDVLLKLKDRLSLSLFVVHINHCIREEAKVEEEYVEKLCRKYEIPFFLRRIKVLDLAQNEKKSVEETARDIRYSAFNEILDEVRADKIAVAHKANDLAENVIMNLIRGTGINGLCGIKKCNGNIIRPLINVARSEIEGYVKENDLTVFYDRTNFETEYTRNKIRNIVIPEILKINPSFIENTLRTSEILSGQIKILDETIDEKYRKIKVTEGVLDKKAFLE